MRFITILNTNYHEIFKENNFYVHSSIGINSMLKPVS